MFYVSIRAYFVCHTAVLQIQYLPDHETKYLVYVCAQKYAQIRNDTRRICIGSAMLLRNDKALIICVLMSVMLVTYFDARALIRHPQNTVTGS